MQESLLQTYRDLMGSLQALPDNIVAEQERLEGQERDLAALAQACETTEHAYIASAGGWKSLGSNDKERELVLADFRRADKAMRDLSLQARNTRFAVEETRRVLAGLERRYGAVCYQVRLHAALLQYLGNAGVPAPAAVPSVTIVPTAPRGDVNFYSTNGNVSAADAALIGL